MADFVLLCLYISGALYISILLRWHHRWLKLVVAWAWPMFLLLMVAQYITEAFSAEWTQE
jgi:hypothetical protein